MRRIAKLQIILVVTVAPWCAADLLRVPGDYATIQAAIDAAADGDTVVVAPGRYTGDGNRNIDFRGKAITVRSEAGPETCIIDAQGSFAASHRGFHFHNGETASSVLQGFTIVNGYTGGYGGAIYCHDSSPTIIDCVLTHNRADLGGGLAAVDSGVRVIRCIVSNNVVRRYGGGIYLSRWKTSRAVARFEGCLIVGNRVFFLDRPPTMAGEDGSGGGLWVAADCEIVNCTIVGNRTGSRGDGVTFRGHGGAISNSIIWGNTVGTAHCAEVKIVLAEPGPLRRVVLHIVAIEHSMIGSGDANDVRIVRGGAVNLSGSWLAGDPYFAKLGYWDPNGTPDNPNDDFWVDGDYHLKSQGGRWDPVAGVWVRDDVTSPCIDVGDPMSPIGHEPFPNGGRINMGNYGGTAEASKSYFGEPICETILPGDLNGDCRVDWKDLAILARHWLRDETAQ